ncbi:MAG TPA: hypothetical protein VN040_04000 [Pseudosphingobacterium sp.]|nr:hypothetical protein [Pseudosphingobacterium sp.]
MKENATTRKLGSNLPVFIYQDALWIALGTAVIAGVLCYYGYKGAFLAGMTDVPFFVVFGMFALITNVLLRYIAARIRFLDRHYNWLDDWLMRLVYQSLWCWLFPVLFLFFLYIFCYTWLPVSILQSGFLDTDLVLITLLVLGVNALYTLVFFVRLHNWDVKIIGVWKKRYRLLFAKWEKATTMNRTLGVDLLSAQSEQVRMQQKMKEAIAEGKAWKEKFIEQEKERNDSKKEISKLKKQLKNYERELKEYRQSGKKEIKQELIYVLKTSKVIKSFSYKEIGYFCVENTLTYLVPIDGSDKIPANEKSLKEVQTLTNNYFRYVDRHTLVPQHAIASCKSLKGGKLLLRLEAPLNKEITITKTYAEPLLEWILEVVKEIKV